MEFSPPVPRPDQEDIRTAIADVLRPLAVRGGLKTGYSQLQPQIAALLRSRGFEVDEEDSGRFLKSKMPVWRSKDTNEVVPTRSRRKIDIVVRRDAELVALVETESDLDDLKEHGVTKRNGHYDVFSIARDGDGNWFNSYNSLERMAAAAFYFHHAQASSDYPDPGLGVELLEQVRSDDVAVHNPSRIAMYLVSGKVREGDPGIIGRRLGSLGAELMCATGPPPYHVGGRV